MANLKTDESYFNKDNFVERDGKLQEIVVSVTLEEYRGLVATKASLQQQVWDKNEKIRKLESDLAKAVEKAAYLEKERCALQFALECAHDRAADVEGSGEDADE